MWLWMGILWQRFGGGSTRPKDPLIYSTLLNMDLSQQTVAKTSPGPLTELEAIAART